MTLLERKKLELYVLQQAEKQGLFKGELDYKGMRYEKTQEIKMLQKLPEGSECCIQNVTKEARNYWEAVKKKIGGV